MYTLAVFDMDGTILNTLEDLQTSLNYSLELWGYPPRSLEQVRAAVGNGIRTLIVRSLPEGTEDAVIDRIYQSFLPHYQCHCADKTRPYPGILAAISALQGKGLTCAVVSNKADAAVRDLCRQYFPDCFALSVGERPGVRPKPAPDAVEEVLRALHTPREKAVYIGDSEVDYATAVHAGLDYVLVTWGFRDRAALEALGARTFAESTEELVEMITKT